MSQFPDPRISSPEGLVAVGGDLSHDMLVDAYSHGIFPWPHEDYPMLWFSPDPRGVLDFKDFRVPRSLQKWAKARSNWSYTINQAFPEVIKYCQAQARPGQDGTWITNEIQIAYENFFKKGKVLSLEVWEEIDGDKKLIGGIYGVDNNGLFSGESMFFLKPNASKMALWKMIEHLRSIGRTWIDIQMVTPVTESMGGKYIPREEYLARIGV